MNDPSNPLYGPFSLQTFNKTPWNHMRETLSDSFVQDQIQIASQHLLQFLRRLNSCPDLDQHFGDPSIKNFFFDDFLFKSIAIIVSRNLFESPEIENIFNNCLQQATFLWAKALEQGHFNLTETFKLILNPFQPYYVTPFISFTRTKGDMGFFNKLVIDLVEHGSFNLIPSLILNKERPLSREAASSLCKVVTQLPVIPQTIEIKFKVCAACLESENSEVRTLGLYLIIDIIDRVPTLGDSFQQTFNEFLRQQDIFNKVYKDPENTPLVMKSKYLLLYQFDHGLINEDDYETLVQSLIRTVNIANIDLKQVCGTLQASQTKDRLVKYIIPRVLDSAPEEITTGHIELLFFAYNLSEKSANIAQQIQDFYWGILIENVDAYNPELYQPTVGRFSKIAEKRDPHKYISTVILDCIDNIKQETSVYASIRLTKHFIGLCPDTPSRDEQESSLTMCVNYLCDELGLLRLIVDGLMSLKSSVRDEIPNETSFMTEIRQRIEFIEYLGINGTRDYPLITYELLLGLWKEFVRNSFFKEEKNCIFRLVKNLAERNKDFLGSIPNLEKFFIEEIVHLEFRNDIRTTKEGILCFKTLFLIINESHNNLVKRTEDSEFDSEFVIKVFPEELIAFETIWDIILLSQNQDALKGAIDLLAPIYYSLDISLEANADQIRQACLDQIFQHIKEITEQKKAIKQEFYTEEEGNLFRQKCCRCLLILDRMISESQINGLGDMKTHLQLAKGELIELTVKSYIHAEETEISDNITITLNYNTTVFELRTEIGRQFKVWFDEVILMKDSEVSQVEIPLLENSRTLYELGIEKDKSVIARRREIPKAKMTMKDGSLNPQIIRVYKEWFEIYSDHGKMSPEQFCGFAKMFADDIEPDGADSYHAFQLYGYERDSYLYFRAFYDLCEQIRQDNSDTLAEKIWSGRRNDLKFPSEINKKVDKCSLIAYMISSKDEHFDLLMSLLEWESVIASQTWALLHRIPTNQKLFDDILALKDVKDVVEPQDISWNTLLRLESKHLMLYALDIVEYLLDDTSEDRGVYIAIELKKKWQEEFSFYGGFDHLCKILKIFKPAEPPVSMSREHRRIASFIKTIQNKFGSFGVEILDQNEKQKRILVEFLQLSSEYTQSLYTV